MLFHAKEEELLLLAVPVAPDSLENAGTIVYEVGLYPYFGFLEGHDLLLKIGI